MKATNRRASIEIALILLLALVLSGTGIWLRGRRTEQRIAREAYEERMRLPDTLRIVTLSGATTYFTYREEPMGYQYELAKLMADSLGIPMTIHTAPNLETIHSLISSNQMDLSITPEAISAPGQEQYLYTGIEELSGMVLVQRKRRVSKQGYVKNVTELLGKQIHVLAESRFQQRLLNIEEQLGGDIDIVLLTGDTINSEDLIAQVDRGDIDYTVVDSELAKLTLKFYPNIDIKVEIGFPQRLKWIVAPSREGLAIAIDRWAQEAPQVDEYKQIYKRYFVDEEPDEEQAPAQDYALRGEAQHLGKGRLSPYDALFRHEAPRIGWDWQILASIAYQESNFRAEVIGWSGARGLMGIMPNTGKNFGASKAELLDPAISVRVSVDCLLATLRSFKSITDPEQRIKMTLAGYNAGVAHVQDAQRLAKKYGADPNRWDGNVEEYVRLKSEPKYYNDPVCKYGYLRGRETYKYVREVMHRYHYYLGKS